MRRNSTDLLVVGILALLAVAVSSISGDQSNILRAALGLPFVLFLPGYALSAGLLPDARIGLAERIAFSVGLSIAVAALGGLALNFLPSGLTARSWRFLLLGVTVCGAAYALWRRHHDRISGPGPLVTQISMREAALVTAAAVLIGLALGVGAIGVDPLGRNSPGAASFTQFWAVSKQNSQQTVVDLGLQNYENQRVTYLVTLESGNRTLAEWPQLTLDAGAAWEVQATLPPNPSAQEISANVYRAGDAAPYRKVWLAPQSGSSK